jgi:hypothetical protein
MAIALYFGDSIAIHVFQQDLEVAKARPTAHFLCHGSPLCAFIGILSPISARDGFICVLTMLLSVCLSSYSNAAAACGRVHTWYDPRTVAIHLELCYDEGALQLLAPASAQCQSVSSLSR